MGVASVFVSEDILIDDMSSEDDGLVFVSLLQPIIIKETISKLLQCTQALMLPQPR